MGVQYSIVHQLETRFIRMNLIRGGVYIERSKRSADTAFVLVH